MTNSSNLLALCLVSICLNSGLAQKESVSPAALPELAAYPHKIVFESYGADNWDLFVINADGSGRRNLTNTLNVHEMYPQSSPDGRRVCFLADIQKEGETVRSVYYSDADGAKRVRVAEAAKQPCWSPDGTTIAFVKQEFKRFRVDDYVSKHLYFYGLASGKITQHPNDSIHHLYGLSWSGDGDWIVSTVHGGMGFGHAILAIEVAGSKVFDLKIPGCRPCLSPDGTQVTWSKNDHTICVADVVVTASGATVSNERVVDHDEVLHLYHPDFSPDGKYISYSVGPGGRVRADGPGTHTHVAEIVGVRGKWNLCLKRASGEGPRVQLTTDASLSNKESEWLFVDSARGKK